jgi:hypothetical protein
MTKSGFAIAVANPMACLRHKHVIEQGESWMPRFCSFAAFAAAGLVAGALTTTAMASPIQGDKNVATWVLKPLTSLATGASGEATMQLDWAARKFCYALDLRGLDGPVTAATISKGTDGQFIALKKALRGEAWDGCVDASPAQAAAILANPADYFVTVKTAGSPNGALRVRLDNPEGILVR